LQQIKTRVCRSILFLISSLSCVLATSQTTRRGLRCLETRVDGTCSTGR